MVDRQCSSSLISLVSSSSSTTSSASLSSASPRGDCHSCNNNCNNNKNNSSSSRSNIRYASGASVGGGWTSWSAAALLLLATLLVQGPYLTNASAPSDPVSTLECHRRQYTYKVHKTDDAGRNCWDYINVMSCWGRCDSNEIADWKFPFKRSHHPVCMHGETKLTEVVLRNCDDGTAPGTEIYKFHDAMACACSLCKSNEASCEGLRYRGARRAPSRRAPPRDNNRRG